PPHAARHSTARGRKPPPPQPPNARRGLRPAASRPPRSFSGPPSLCLLLSGLRLPGHIEVLAHQAPGFVRIARLDCAINAAMHFRRFLDVGSPLDGEPAN